MKVALVHDYIKEYGGAERVLRVLSDIYPDAPIYTAFRVKGSTANKAFVDKRIIESRWAPLLKIWKFYSPLRFLIPWIWRSMDLSQFDLVISSASWYITRGFKVGPKTKVVCYCHTPPRWLYGYQTSVGFTKYWPVKVYSAIVSHFLRLYDFRTAQRSDRNQFKFKSKIMGGVDYFIANSENVRKRIKKFYRRESVVIYPPVDVEKIIHFSTTLHSDVEKLKKEKYFLIVSRLVGAKGIENAIKAFQTKDSLQSTDYGLQQNKLPRANSIRYSRPTGSTSLSSVHFPVLFSAALSSAQNYTGHPRLNRGFREKNDKLMKKKDNYKLKIVGETHGYSDIEYQISNLDSSNIEFLGRVNDEELWKLYAGAAGFVALARDEDFGMTVVEAQAAGCPVIAFNGGGFKETVINKETGILINDTDEKTLQKAINDLISKKWDKKKLRENSKKFSKEQFIKSFQKELVNKIIME